MKKFSAKKLGFSKKISDRAAVVRNPSAPPDNNRARLTQTEAERLLRYNPPNWKILLKQAI
ncbi:MAG: hypothetical protein HFE29_01445 [Clostridia bacterium]|jgi:hypothetical protein|nr:hypothetical protein [Clostridia bacterium]